MNTIISSMVASPPNPRSYLDRYCSGCLPTELRLMIWHWVLPRPETIELTHLDRITLPRERPPLGYLSNIRIELSDELLRERQFINLLLVCRESRDEVLKFFKFHRISNTPIYFTFEHDMFRFHRPRLQPFNTTRSFEDTISTREPSPSTSCSEDEFENLCMDIQRIGISSGLILLYGYLRIGEMNRPLNVSLKTQDALVSWFSLKHQGYNRWFSQHPLPQLKHMRLELVLHKSLHIHMAECQWMLARDGMEVFREKYGRAVWGPDWSQAPGFLKGLEQFTCNNWRLKRAQRELELLKHVVDCELVKSQKSGKNFTRPSLSIRYVATDQWVLIPGESLGSLEYEGYEGDEDDEYVDDDVRWIENPEGWEIAELLETDLDPKV